MSTHLYTLYLIVAHQKTQRDNPARPPNQFNNAVFDNVDVKRCFVQIDGVRHPKDPVETNYSENKYLDQYRDLKIFYKEYNGESFLSPFIIYLDMKTFYLIQVIDLRFQTDEITPKKIRLSEKHENTSKTLIYMLYSLNTKRLGWFQTEKELPGLNLFK